MTAPGARVPVVITVDDRHLSDLRRIAERCRAAGLELDQALDAVGVITGAIDPGRIGELAAIPGVAGVELAGGYDIGPPGSRIR